MDSDLESGTIRETAPCITARLVVAFLVYFDREITPLLELIRRRVLLCAPFNTLATSGTPGGGVAPRLNCLVFDTNQLLIPVSFTRRLGVQPSGGSR